MSMLCRDTWQRMEKRIKQLPKPPRSDAEQPIWAIPSDGLPSVSRGRMWMKIVRVYPSGWNGYPVFVDVDLEALERTQTATEDALMSELLRRIQPPALQRESEG